VDEFKKDLEALLNRHSIENEVDMPDFILAEMVCRFIVAVGEPIKRTLTWHGCDSICHPKEPTEPDFPPLPSGQVGPMPDRDK